MSEQHEVTVYDRVAATGKISVAQIERYLERTGWKRSRGEATVRGFRMMFASLWRDGSGLVALSPSAPPYVLSEAIDEISRWEARRPSAVLADIAKEQA